MNVDYEFFRNDLILVLANVFRAKLHLSSLDVISSLNEGCIEHYTEHDFVRPAAFRHEDNLHITLKQRLLLLFL